MSESTPAGGSLIGTAEKSDRRVLRVDARDNVVIALADLRQGESVAFEGGVYELVTDVPAKHKFALQPLNVGEHVIMYGVVVGKATQPIRRGERISVLNLKHEAAPYQKRKTSREWRAPNVSRWRGRTFAGYQRSDGQVGTRNYWLVAPLVFCENRNILVLKQAFEEELGFAPPQPYRQRVADLVNAYRSGKTEPGASPHNGDAATQRVFENVDGVKFLLHEGGCGGTREDTNNLCALIAGYIHHPNVAGATVLSLGCQHAQIDILREEIRKRNPYFDKPLVILEQQQSRSEADMLNAAIRETFTGLVDTNKLQRTPAALSKLRMGLKCGGSDGFSGISANPAVGHAADLLVALGGSGILSEFPELCGVEQELIDRCVNDAVADRFIQLMSEYANRAQAVRAAFSMNPSPGNIKDGLITDAMKSAGAAKKGGTSPVTAVVDYGEYATQPGLHLQCTPGNDVECVTAQVGAGCNVVLFTTGLGTPTGNPIAPVVKISTNTPLVQRMGDIIDVNTGGVITGEMSIEQAGEELLEAAIRVAGGEKTKAEQLGQDDFIPWKRGVSL